jgi:hypothetical protein
LKFDGALVSKKSFADSTLAMYLGNQDDVRASPVFRLYVPLLALNSGSGGQFRAHLKDTKQQLSGRTSTGAAISEIGAFLF